MIETVKDFFIMIWMLLKGMPMTFFVVLGVLIIFSAFLSGLMCIFDLKKKKKELKNPKENLNQDKISKEKDEKKTTIEEKDSLKTTKSRTKNNVKENISIEKIKIPEVDDLPFIIGDLEIDFYSYKNVKITESNFIDQLELSKKGIYLLFIDKTLKGVLSGDKEDEYLIIKKKKILNPIFSKHYYKTLVNKWFNTEKDLIQTVLIAPKIKKSQPELLIFKSLDDFNNYLLQKPDLLTINQLFNLNEKVYFLGKRR